MTGSRPDASLVRRVVAWVWPWSKATWAVVIWGLAVALAFKLIFEERASDLSFTPAGLLYGLALLAWFICALAWALTRLQSLARRLGDHARR